MKNILSRPIAPSKYSVHQKATLGLSIWLLLAVNFTLNYLIFTYFSNEFLEFTSPGFWLFWLNNIFLLSVLIFTKQAMPWSWNELGLAKPKAWWKPILTFLLTFGCVVIFSQSVSPLIIDTFGKHQNISFVYSVKGNLPGLIYLLIVVWVTAAFLEEIIFRALLINSFDILLGKSGLSALAAVFISAIIFSGIHAYQGLTGILTTGAMGIIFGVAYLFNGRRIWPLILMHGLIDTIMLVGVYNS